MFTLNYCCWKAARAFDFNEKYNQLIANTGTCDLALIRVALKSVMSNQRNPFYPLNDASESRNK